MKTSDKVRQRRQERIRTIRYSAKANRPTGIDGSEHKHSSISSPHQPVHYDDPELAWKYRDNPWEIDSNRNKGSFWRSGGGFNPLTGELGGKLIVSAALFALVWGLFQVDREWAMPGQKLVRHTLTQQSDFSTLAVWYESIFDGAPSLIPTFRHPDIPQAEKVNALVSMALFAPMQGQVELADGQEGIWRIVGNGAASVLAFAEGRVLAVTEKDAGFDVVLQHVDGLRTIYAGLSTTSLAVHDWVKGGEVIGAPGFQEGPPTILFALKQDNQPLDPTDVVAFE